MAPPIQKVLQKKIYDVLSHRYGILIIIVGIFLCVIAAFHFGEVFLEWSEAKYSALFNPYVNNIAKKSFQKQLCLPVPIDVVYTWVNGSDPQLKADLQLYKSRMERNLNITRYTACQFRNCVPANFYILEPALPDNIKSNLTTLMPSLPRIVSVYNVPYSYHNKENFTVIEFTSNVDVSALQNVSFTFDKITYKSTRGYLTSDCDVVPGVVLSDRLLVSGFSAQYNVHRIKERFPKHLQTHITHVDVRSDTGLIIFHINNSTVFNELLKSTNITIEGKSLSFFRANLIWHLSPLMDDDATKLSRFEDNESLKYSLRSLEMFAPWVRNVYLVTNGQIPSWLNLENDRLFLVSHQDIFPNKSHLPTFSSSAIESHLHQIKGLSQYFLYLNDDIMFGKEVWPDDFFTNAKGHKVPCFYKED